MDVRKQRVLLGAAETVIVLAAIFLLLDAVLGFTGHRQLTTAQSRPVSQNIDGANLAITCAGGFANKQTVHGVTQAAAHGMPFNAYQLTLTNTGATALPVRSVSVELLDHRHEVFAQHRTDLGGAAGLTLGPGRSRRIVEAYGIDQAVASCEILGWQP